MFRMLIADDNNLDRRMLQTMIDWSALGIEVVSTAVDGQDALEKINQACPDIVLTDIAMPGLNGIELATLLKQNHPEIKVVFMSCYDDFQYAHAAVNLNTSGYVLKPIMTDELQRVFINTVSVLERERRIQSERLELEHRMNSYLELMKDSFAREWILGHYSDDIELKKQIEFLKIEIPLFPNWAVLLVGLETAGQDVEERYIADTAVRSHLAWKNGEDHWFLPVKTGADKLACILGIDRTNRSEALNIAVEAAALLQTLLADVVKSKGAIAVSDTACKLTDVPMLYAQAEEILEKRAMYNHEASVLLYTDLRDESSLGLLNDYNLRLLKSASMELLDPYNESRLAIKAFISQYNTEFKPATHLLTDLLLASVMEQGNTALATARTKLHNFIDESITVQEAVNKLVDYIKIKSDEAAKRTSSWADQVVSSIKSIIHTSYMEQLSLLDIARAVNYSAKQANNIFKRQTEKNIFDYFTEYRMEVAAKLLLENTTSINTVAQSVGYSNVAHFKALFQRKYGESPLAFREIHGRKIPL